MSESTDNNSEPVTVIVPGGAALRDSDDTGVTPSRGATLRLVVIAVLCLMLLILAGVVVVLPDLVAERSLDEQKPAVVSPAVVPPAPPPSPDEQRLAKDKREAEKWLGIVLEKQTEIEAEGVAIWGGQDYDVALDTLAAGDAQLQGGRYAQSTVNYQTLSAQLDALRASMADRLASALDAGDAALDGNDGPMARHSFTVALAIEPHNERAQQGMLRARVLEEVRSLIAAGAEHEGRDRLDAARDKYASALALDKRSRDASVAHEAVTGKIRERAFRAAMSVALAALEMGNFVAARAALSRANGIKPGAPAVADVGTRLELAVQGSRIGAHRKQAKTLERDERWQEASERYAAVLAIDSKAAFALAGRRRSLARARIHAEMDAYLAQLGRLSAPGPRDNARRLLGAAADLDAKTEPKLAAKAMRLAKAVAISQTPMEVRLQSDNLTDVTVYKVGRFGRFASRDLVLLPGTYVAVGRRSGYRDVRVEFTLTGGQEPADVTILCQEKI